MSEKYCITWPTKRQRRRFVVAAIEDVIVLIGGTAAVAAGTVLAGVLLKACGVL